MRPHLFALLGAAALGLAACSENDDLKPTGKLCPDWKARPASTDAAAPVDECVKRWAFALAPSDDDADTVAAASVAACSAALSRWNQQSLAQPPAEGEPLSIITGQPTNPIAEHNAFANGRALLYVVQARAGNCAAPPIKDGVPEGLAG